MPDRERGRQSVWPAVYGKGCLAVGVNPPTAIPFARTARRYSNRCPTAVAMSDSRETFRFRDFELDVAAYELRRHGRLVRPQRQPIDMLILP